MRRSNPTIAGLMALVLFGAAGFAALRSGTVWSMRIAHTATVLVLLMAAAAARSRPFAYGFAAVGWAYFLVGFGPWFAVNNPVGNPFNFPNNALLTNYWLRRACDAAGVPQANKGYVFGVAHALLTLLLAACGGTIAQRLAEQPRSRLIRVR